jgi:hypothetical protein
MNAPDLPHWTPKSCFGAFQTVSLLHEFWCKMCQTGAIIEQVRATTSRRNLSHQMHPIHPIVLKLMFLGHFGLFRYCTNFSAKRAKHVRLMHKFMQRSRVGMFRNERIRSTPFVPKLMFWAFRTISLLHELWCKTGSTGAINALVRATKSRRNFSQRTHPIHPIGPQTHVLWRFRPFRYCKKFGAKCAELVN